MSYLSFYGLEFNPFEKGNKDIVVETQDYLDMKNRLEYLKEVKGVGLITGNPGFGKTFALRNFAKSLNPSLYTVIYLPLSTLSLSDFYRAFAGALGLEPRYRKNDNYKIIKEKISHLHQEKRNTLVLILDEANHLRYEILQEIKMLMNFELDSKNYFIMILAGLPSINDTLRLSVHESLTQRVVVNYQCYGMDNEETKSYIRTKLRAAGVSIDIFDEAAIHALFSHSKGSSRRLDNFISKALIIGAGEKTQILTAETIMKAFEEIKIGG